MSENEVRALYDTLIAGWNDHDGTAMAALFAADGVVIGFDGSLSSGKQTIGTEMSNIFADHETGRYAVKVKSLRELGQHAMILRAIAGLVPPGQIAIKPRHEFPPDRRRRRSGWSMEDCAFPEHSRSVPRPP